VKRSLKEAAEELCARIATAESRVFPVGGLKGAAATLMLREVALRLERPIVAITPRAQEASAFAHELAFFMDEPMDRDPVDRRIHLLPGAEIKPFAHLSPPIDQQAQHFAALYALARGRMPVIVAPVEAVATRIIPPVEFTQSIITITPADRFDLDLLVESLIGLGYQRIPQVEEPGDFSVRGGSIDIFSPLHHQPVRIELEDDLVVSLRRFETASQRSLGEVDRLTIVRARHIAASALKDERVLERVRIRAAEIELVRKESGELLESLESGLLFPGVEMLQPYLYLDGMASLFDYMPANTILWLVEPGRVLAEAINFDARVAAEAEAAQARHVFYPSPTATFANSEDLRRHFEGLLTVEINPLIVLAPPRSEHAVTIEVETQPSPKIGSNKLNGAQMAPSFEPLAVQLREVQRSQGRALMIVEGTNQAARLRRHLEAYQIEVNGDCKSYSELLEWPDFRPAIMEGEIAAGAVLPRDGLYLYSEEDIFGEPRVHRRARPIGKGALLNLEELKHDDFVVHLDHGIGRYRGLKHLKIAGIEGDFLNLEYAGNDTMYVPVERINLVQRYVGGENVEPKLDRLGSGNWEKVKQRTKKAVLAMAGELLEVYAAREVMEGHAFPHPGRDYHDFADRFEFDETPDQAAAIDDVIRDMARPRPMDRLICGDAGFGKTEVAMRAAFIAVMDGRQVAMLLPTTVLAEQHWQTFTRRFRDYPVRIEMVSRFRSPAENRAVIEGLRQGAVDIVIGTQRLLQSDVEFKKLGLLIIDEEHRFGVADKERLKRMRKLVDVLTMTATPIPRTLHMAMLGIRDLSLIQTPPPDRQSIRTFVAHFDDDLVRDVILRELNRGGQVFFVHNRVENIEYVARHLRTLVPEARFAIAHGQMGGKELEEVMLGFIEGRVNVLVCSAIIESGLDIPNANTMIINRADHFGLAQLYQLRGRVGRSRQRAYAYLLIPGEHIITRDAKRRIEALRELVESDSGGGFKLAMHDLEHRGAGNLLGREQSGQIAAVGFELYTEMMEEAIHELRGEPQRADFEPELRLEIPAYIPADYAPDETERLTIYRRMAKAQSWEDLRELRDELRDRFGPPPTLIDNLLAAMDLRRQMRELMILSAILKGDQVEIRFHADAPVDTSKLAALANANRHKIRLTPSFQVIARIQLGDYELVFAQLNEILQALAGCERLEISSGRGSELAN
jgi:transcription-repair coupling factor (superfamily II helicase)